MYGTEADIYLNLDGDDTATTHPQPSVPVAVFVNAAKGARPSPGSS